MYDVITVGSATIDVFASTEFSEIIAIKEPKKETELLAYPLGSKILIKQILFSTGGGGTNTAVSFSRLGLKTAWLGKLGNDANAQTVISELKKEKIDILAEKGKGFTGYSVILDSIKDDRTILTYKGVNDDFTFKEIPLKKIKTKWFYFCSMMDKSYIAIEQLGAYAKKNSIKIAFNASSYLVKKGTVYLGKLLSMTDIFILNDEEAAILVGYNTIEEMLKKIHLLGPKIVVITEGSKGAHTYDGNYIYSLAGGKVKVVETTGAGDAFASGFVSGIIKKGDIEFALKLGKANAESVITYHGAKNKLLKYSEALRYIESHHAKINKTKKR